ncbi:GD22670, related, related [Eimeria acervulina]|uniref:GD22670, related, related n=1 Tax=Eimeria acervulina TaxID=5801 RepID=U6GF21_EIMAC|nr:GD22670, related, related [Eimeria acervulina]CDI77943.1 GD22670, related, related [Eimeria acervulina]
MDPSEAIPVLMDVAGIPDADTARRFLEQAKGDINAAASLYIDSVAANNGVSLSDPGEGLRAPDPEYSQTLLSPSFHPSQAAASSAGFPQRNVTALAVDSSAGTVAFRDLFELPGGLSCQEPFARARELGREQNKWLLVNIQQVDAFESLRLNRDVWKAEVVQVICTWILSKTSSSSGKEQIDVKKAKFSATCIASFVPYSGHVSASFFEFVERQQMADSKSKRGEKPSEDSNAVPSGAPVVSATPAAAAAAAAAGAPSEASFANPASLSAAAAAADAPAALTVDEADTSMGGHQLQSHKTSADEAEPSAYKEVNSQLLDLMRLREQRRQQQGKTETQS